MRRMLVSLMSLAVLASAALGQTVLYNESISGDLSNSAAAPNAFTLSSGANSVIGSVGSPDNQDWFSLTVPANFKLTSIVLVSYSSTDCAGFHRVWKWPDVHRLTILRRQLRRVFAFRDGCHQRSAAADQSHRSGFAPDYGGPDAGGWRDRFHATAG